MKFEPETFFIGLIDFFSVMLPGAVVTFVIKSQAESVLFGSAFPKYSGEAEGWAVFLFSSYLMGHFIFLLGSRLDDDYERIRNATAEIEENRVKNGEKPSSRFFKWLAKNLFPKNSHVALGQALKIKEKYIPEFEGTTVINAFQWSKARLITQCPAAFLEVQRFEADSKFFRSFVIVLFLLTIWASINAILGKSPWYLALFCLLIAGLSFSRYAERRFKATQQAYWYVITLENYPAPDKGKKNRDLFNDAIEEKKTSEITHAGGVVYQTNNKSAQYLLIRPRLNEKEWVLPKGHIYKGEDPSIAALREVTEETGVIARVRTSLGILQFKTNEEKVRVKFFLMEKESESVPHELRQVAWFQFEEALRLATHDETKRVLRAAEVKRVALLQQKPAEDNKRIR